jgi:hypothetical protein
MLFCDTVTGERSLIFIAGFHLGMPLGICRTRKSRDWTAMHSELAKSFRLHSTRFEVCRTDFDPETKFPLGTPFVIRHLDFLSMFDLPQVLLGAQAKTWDERYRFDNAIWVCPSGVVLIIGEISCLADDGIQLHKLERITENHYPNLTSIFIEVAEIIIALFPRRVLRSSLCCTSSIVTSFDLNGKLQALGGPAILANPTAAEKSDLDVQQVSKLYEDILIDVYFIDVEWTAKSELIIGYVDSQIKSSEREFVWLLTIAFSSFVGLLWIQEHLSERAYILYQSLSGLSSLQKRAAFELKLFRIFCLKLIGDSKPISIRLTHRYMECLEEFWKEERMSFLVDQISDQLNTLGKMFDWVEDIGRETRNFKIGLIAVLLALVSLAAVVAQLISTIDVNTQMGAPERVHLILIGLISGALITLAIYLLPLSKRR